MAVPAGPRLPNAVQMTAWLARPIPFIERCRRQFGTVFTLRFIQYEPLVVIAEPSMIKEIFSGPTDVLWAGQSNAILAPFLGETSVLCADGSTHQRLRKLMMPAFHGERMQAFGQTMLDVADEVVDRMPIGKPFPIHPHMQEITLEVILRTIFGVSDNQRLAELSDLVRASLDLLSWPPMLFPQMQKDYGAWSPWGRFLRISAGVDRILQAEIDDRRSKTHDRRDDVLTALVSSRDEQGLGLSDQEIKEQLVTLLVAGHETTATSLAWAVNGLLDEPAFARELAAEVARATHDGALEADRVVKLELLDATVKEALRLLPVIPFVGRTLQTPFRIGNLDLPAGAIAAPSIYLAHHDERSFPDSKRFDPKRFLRERPTPFEYFPFGGGGRRCLGAAFATYEMKMVLATMVSRLALARGTTRPTGVVRRSITFAPSGGLPVRVLSRKRPSKIAA